jgi:predicted TIM-barrel fold metal-dependent hydrolase
VRRYELISVDDHIIEPPGVWVDRLPAKYREVGPHVIEADGRQYWEFEGQRSPTMGLVATAGRPKEEWDANPIRYEDMIPGCYDPKARADDFRAAGIVGSLGFPSLPAFAGTLFLRFQDRVLADLSVKAWNDFVLDEWCPTAPDLYIPMIITQLWDPEAAAAEIRRCAEKGNRALSFAENPVPLGLPSFYTDHWDPVWRACTETDTVVNLHVGTSGSLAHTSPEAGFSLTIILAQINAQLALINFLHSMTLQRHPDLQVVFSEGGIGWIPNILERADHMWDNHQGWDNLAADIRPSDMFRRNCYGAWLNDEVGIELRHHIGVDRILYESDYPHSETAWPDSQQAVDKLVVGVPDDEVEAMTNGNARRLYRWPKTT